MAELSTDDVVAFTGGRLADDDETQRMLDTALVVARRYCGWHVSPVHTEESFTLDGPGGTELFPPTRRIVEVTAATSDSVDVSANVVVPIDAFTWPPSARKIVLTTGTWSTAYSGVVVELTHGYTEDEAQDWRQAILTMVDQMGSSLGRSDADLIGKQVDDVIYRWSPLAEEALYSVKPILDMYELRPVFLA